MRMIRIRNVPDETFDILTRQAALRGTNLAAVCRDALVEAALRLTGVSGVPDTAPVKPAKPKKEKAAAPEPVADLPPQRSGVGRPTAEQWERLNKWLAATERQPEPGEVTTRSGLLAWAVAQGFQP